MDLCVIYTNLKGVVYAAHSLEKCHLVKSDERYNLLND